MARLRLSWRLLQVGLHLGLGTLLTFGAALVARGPSARTIQWWHNRLNRILGIRVHLLGEPLEAGALLVCNHVSWLDIPVLGSLLPLRFIAKSDVRAWPLVGWLSARAGTLFLRRGSENLRPVSLAMSLVLRRGGALALFPEGTTTDGTDVRPFFPRLLAPAIKTGRPIQPVAIRYLSDGALSRAAPFVGNDNLVGHLFGLAHEPRIDVFVCACPTVDVGSHDRRALAIEARRAIRQCLPGLPDGLAEPVPDAMCPAERIAAGAP